MPLPGGRNSPFVSVLCRLQDIEVLYFFDERASAFFALGRAKRDGRPVAVITTSGTAVAELYPAVIEARYSGAPLVLITADYPKAFKNTSAPQCIEQDQIFSKTAQATLHFEAVSNSHPSQWNIFQKKFNRLKKTFLKTRLNKQWKKIHQRPIHINARFDEPLVDEKHSAPPIDQACFSELTEQKPPLPKEMRSSQKQDLPHQNKETFSAHNSSSPSQETHPKNHLKKNLQINLRNKDDHQAIFKNSDTTTSQPYTKEYLCQSKIRFAQYWREIRSFLKKSKKPVILLTGLPPGLQNAVESALLKLSRPVYAEPLSQLRDSTALNPLMLKSGEAILNQAVRNQWIDGVIRIGAIPAVRLWRDLNQMSLPALSFSLSDFSGLKNQPQALPLSAFLNCDFSSQVDDCFKNIQKHYKELFDQDRLQTQNMEQSLEKNPKSEPAWIRRISQNLPEGSHIFLGNSLPIREWDAYAERKNKNFIYTGNRGANGIDGLLSSFFGLCRPSIPNYCILGDLSALYDLSAPWIFKANEKF